MREKPSPFVLIGLPQPMLHRDVPTLAADYGHVVIDGLPRNYEVTRSAIAAADLVLIPVQPSAADFWASRETVKLAEEAHCGRGQPVPGWFWIRPHRRLAWDRRRTIISLNYARSAPSCCIGTSARWATARAATLGCALGTPGTGLSQRAIPNRALQIRPTESCPD